MHAPLIGHDKTSIKGMMLNNASMLKILGLLQKQENGQYTLGPNATKNCLRAW